MILPSSLVFSQGWGLIDLPLRASNEGLLRPRVARAQKIIRLHPLRCSGSKEPARVSFHLSKCSLEKLLRLPHMLLDIRLQMPRSRLPVVGCVADTAG